MGIPGRRWSLVFLSKQTKFKNAVYTCYNGPRCSGWLGILMDIIEHFGFLLACFCLFQNSVSIFFAATEIWLHLVKFRDSHLLST